LIPAVSEGAEGVLPGIVGALVFKMKTWARGLRGLTAGLWAQPAAEGFTILRYGLLQVGKVKKEHVAAVREVMRDTEAKIVDWEECRLFGRLLGELERLKRSLQDELAVITLRRIVPGRCKYCPL
jgi:hypothetical protein